MAWRNVDVGPEHSTGNPLAGVQQMVVIVPINADVDEAEHIAEARGQQLRQCLPGRFLGNLEFKHHDRDQDGQHPIAEGLQPGFAHHVVSAALPRTTLGLRWSGSPPVGAPTAGLEDLHPPLGRVDGRRAPSGARQRRFSIRRRLAPGASLRRQPAPGPSRRTAGLREQQDFNDKARGRAGPTQCQRTGWPHGAQQLQGYASFNMAL
jgi:hypothetical protein